jgi:hypothetical protein
MSYKRTTEGKRVTLAYKARRLTKYAVRPLDINLRHDPRPDSLRVA